MHTSLFIQLSLLKCVLNDDIINVNLLLFNVHYFMFSYHDVPIPKYKIQYLTFNVSFFFFLLHYNEKFYNLTVYFKTQL